MDDIFLISEVFRFPHKKYQWQIKLFKPRIYLFNWQKKQILKKITTPQAYFNNDEYKFLHLCYHYSGARGITSNSKYVFIALQNTISVYDIDLKKQVGRIDHKLFNGIHEIFWHKDKLYVTCAVTDTVLVLSEEGEELQRFPLGKNKYLLDQFNLGVRELDNRLDYRIMHKASRMFHVNSIQVIGENIYINLNRQGSFVKIFPENKIILRDKNLKESHNAQFTPDGEYILINDTGNYALKVYDPKGILLKTVDLKEFPVPVDFSKQGVFDQNHAIKAGWLRGMAFSVENKEIVYLGLSPAMIISVNYMTGKYMGHYRFRKSVWISIHGLHNLSSDPEKES